MSIDAPAAPDRTAFLERIQKSGHEGSVTTTSDLESEEVSVSISEVFY